MGRTWPWPAALRKTRSPRAGPALLAPSPALRVSLALQEFSTHPRNVVPQEPVKAPAFQRSGGAEGDTFEIPDGLAWGLEQDGDTQVAGHEGGRQRGKDPSHSF